MENLGALLEKAVPLIIDWFSKNSRDLPWRMDPTPYHVWISEIMLQQTRIEAVIPYYARFLSAFPTVEALASSDDEQLIKLWEGLGYYSRVRNLKKAAQVLTEFYGGKLPETAAELRKLPGIGDYTAGAIASISFGKPEPAVDGNVLRVMMRLTACSDDVMQAKTKKYVTELLRDVYPSGQRAALLTQGLMELGEVVCLPNALPLCEDCPLKSVCRAYAEGAVTDYPVRSKKKQRRLEDRTVFLLSCNGKYAIRRRDEKGLLAGMWEFPNVCGKMTNAQIKQYFTEHQIEAISCDPCGDAKHIFTHIEWHMSGYTVACASESECFVWKTVEEIRSQYAIPSAFRFYMTLLEKAEDDSNGEMYADSNKTGNY